MRRRAHPSDILAAKAFYGAEQVGGLLYQRFAERLDHPDVAHAIRSMAGDESLHARWYAQWLAEHDSAVPSLVGSELLIQPALKLLVGPQSLDRQLRMFAKGESTAAGHLEALAERVRDPALRDIVIKTIPHERKHGEWYRQEGRKMLRPQDFRRR